jgi:Na+-transporting NADH:ubiquinone oxidoreductase subunit D
MAPMVNNQSMTCLPCEPGGPCRGRGLLTLKDGTWVTNPVAVQILGICSALAVTNRLENSLVMGGALIFVCVCSSLFISLLRNITPRRIRMIAEVMVIATFVILFDQFLKAFYWDMSKQLGPYVALIITNCIIMGRAEAFAMQNSPLLSAVDGLANGLGYAAVLAIIGSARELLGSGKLLGRPVLSGDWFTPNQFMVLAPGAFLALAVVIAIYNALRGPQGKEAK